MGGALAPPPVAHQGSQPRRSGSAASPRSHSGSLPSRRRGDRGRRTVGPAFARPTKDLHRVVDDTHAGANVQLLVAAQRPATGTAHFVFAFPRVRTNEYPTKLPGRCTPTATRQSSSGISWLGAIGIVGLALWSFDTGRASMTCSGPRCHLGQKPASWAALSSSSRWVRHVGSSRCSRRDRRREAIRRGFRRARPTIRIDDRSDQSTGHRVWSVRRMRRLLSDRAVFLTAREIIALVSLGLLYLAFCANSWPSVLP